MLTDPRLDWIGLELEIGLKNLICLSWAGKAFSHEATFQGTQSYSTVQTNHSIHTHTQ